ncbi:MAG: transposase [Mesorhizobium sp.]|uniref:IS66-like element accessory protein TnpA n=2 Tax=Mesorhizobium sp. TaxID=1871066 RepID=UPI000FE59DA2|nr:transposase [Mesorhizobium sp.]RWI44280.1 MAG: transposase [Mesorhizobium sp.]RWL78032.1 MAG: transposase [Mesorhizobium sp.]
MSHVTLLTGPERRRRWSEADQCRILAAAFAPGATVAAVARQYDVATSLIYKWRRTVRARETGFAEVVVAPDEPVARPAASPAVIELEVAGKVGLRIPLTTPPTLAAARVKALGVS